MVTQNYLKWQLRKRAFYSSFDFVSSQLLIWISISGSIVTSAVALFSKPATFAAETKYWIAGLGLIPIALRIIKSNINFRKRAEFNKSYLIELRKLYHTEPDITDTQRGNKYFAIVEKKEAEWNKKNL